MDPMGYGRIQVVAVQQNLVKPRSCDVNENVISESCRTEYGISEEQLKNAVPLEQVIDQFSQWARARLEAEAGGQFYFVTDGQLTLRQALHPEAVRHGILLPDTFYHFFDLRKEFQAFYGKAVDSVQDMLACFPCLGFVAGLTDYDWCRRRARRSVVDALRAGAPGASIALLHPWRRGREDAGSRTFGRTCCVAGSPGLSGTEREAPLLAAFVLDVRRAGPI
ncbi:hypothetical protein HPB52_012386 [Rhipicephalus sanguineus]|uniref:Uncharacterized protein n=1 Tax=Rhipicephalus sanguineus TaxID=34632 RepID=A0A9D4T9Y6_RHISA|nr:hypothetical protein HPB52_012386 [Rhipicephalus sanguineus]